MSDPLQSQQLAPQARPKKLKFKQPHYNKNTFIPKIQKIISDASFESEKLGSPLFYGVNKINKNMSNSIERHESECHGTYHKNSTPERPKSSVYHTNNRNNTSNDRSTILRKSSTSNNTQSGEKIKKKFSFNPQQQTREGLSMHIDLKNLHGKLSSKTQNSNQHHKSSINISPIKFIQKKQICYGSFKNPDDIVYQFFCSKYRKYTKLKKPDEDSQAMRCFHEKQNQILYKMINEGLMEQNQFRLVSKFYDTYMMMKENPVIKKNKEKLSVQKSKNRKLFN